MALTAPRLHRSFGREVDVTADEISALNKLFPDFASEFSDLRERADIAKQPGSGLGSKDDDVADCIPAVSAGEPSAATETLEVAPLRVADEVVLLMFSYHEQVFAAGGRLAAVSATHDSRAVHASFESAKRPGLQGGVRAESEGYCSPVGQVPLDWAHSDRRRLQEAQGEALASVRQAHGIAASLMPSLAPQLPASLDIEARGAQLAFACLAWQDLKGGAAGPQLVCNATVPGTVAANLFLEESSSEVSRLIPLLNATSARVRQLLLQWPEHACLQLMLQVCDRMHSFRAGSPLMKCVIGTELLLKQAYEWESVACQAASVKEHIDSLAALLLRWRRMELHAWPRLLASTAQQANDKALVAVWVDLFRVVNSHLWPVVSSAPAFKFPYEHTTDGRASDVVAAAVASAADLGIVGHEAGVACLADAKPASLVEDRKEHIRQFFTTFEQLMQNASVGAYAARLRLLRAFEQQLRTELRFEAGDSESVSVADHQTHGSDTHQPCQRQHYASILHHMTRYYGQFSAQLHAAVAGRLAPIEAKLRDFVKLGSWSDRNFASLKQCTERSHQQLNRCVLQYQAVLDTPAAVLLGSTPSCDDNKIDSTDSMRDGSAAARAAPATTEQVTAGSREADDSDANMAHTLLQIGLAQVQVAVPVSQWVPIEQLLGLKRPATGPLSRACGSAPRVQSLRLPALCIKMAEFCNTQILSSDSSRRSDERRTYVAALREAVVLRAAQLKKLTDNKARQVKHKALVDLLSELHTTGLTYHASAADGRQASLSSLFMIEAADLDFTSAFTPGSSNRALGAPALPELTESGWQRSWDRSSELYYRCTFKLTQIRHGRPSAHEDLSNREVHKAVGYLEHGFTMLLTQREFVHAALGNAAALDGMLAQLQAIGALASTEPSTQSPSVIVPQQQLTAACQLAHAQLARLAHRAVETLSLFELLASVPTASAGIGPSDSPVPTVPDTKNATLDNGPAGPAQLHAVASVLRRACLWLQEALRALPDVQAYSVHIDVLPSTRREPVLLGSRDEQTLCNAKLQARELHRELISLSVTLAIGLTSQLASVLTELENFGASELTPPAVAAATADGGAERDAAETFLEAIEDVTVQLMLSMQALRKHSPPLHPPSTAAPDPSSTSDNGNDACPKPDHVEPSRPGHCIATQHDLIRNFLLASRAPQLRSCVSAVLGSISLLSDLAPAAARNAAARQAVGLVPALQLHLACLRWGIHQVLGYHGEMVRIVGTNLQVMFQFVP